MNTRSQLLLLGVLSALPAAAVAADPASAAPDTSEWKCEMCQFEQGTSGAFEAGAGTVSNKSAKYGEYNGLEKKGGFFIGEGSARYRGADASYYRLNASNLGLTTRSVDAEGGKQGSYKLRLGYEELPHFHSDTVQTPYMGAGGSSLSLPAGFPAATTGAMPLAASLSQVDLDNNRNRQGAGRAWAPASDWEISVSGRHETKNGRKRTAGAFFVNSAQLVEPVDYSTDQVDASASYTGGRLQAKFGYYGSVYRDANSSLTWQNPYTSLAAGDNFGRLALPPDNQFHQFFASAGYQLTQGTRLSGDVAVGRMTQNEAFLPATINPGLAAPLAANSLNGRADTLNANLKLTSRVTDKLRLNAAYVHDDRDNKTQQLSFTPVVTDTFAAGAPRTNLPYSFKQDKLRVSGDYQLLDRTKASAGVDVDSMRRSFQEARTTNEVTSWGRVISRVADNVDMTFKLARGDRRVSSYQAVTTIVPAENPVLRKYTMAARTRNSMGLRADIAATDDMNIGLGFDAARDSYTDSPIGLTGADEFNVTGDVSFKLSDDTSLRFFANRQEIKSKQAGSQTFSTPDWTGENRDIINFLGAGVKHAAIKDKLDVGADYAVSRSTSEITVNTGAANPRFPDLYASLNSLKLYASYKLKDNVSLNASYWREIYATRNWMLDGVTPNTIPNVLTFGEQPPRYNLNVFRVSMRYAF